MKKLVLLGVVLMSTCLVSGGSSVFAEDNSGEKTEMNNGLENETAASKEALLRADESTNRSDTVVNTEESSKENEEDTDASVYEESSNLREALLKSNVSKELLDSVTDAQIEELSRIATDYYGAQSINMLVDLVVKVYGPNPIPKEAYEVNYSKMSINGLKEFLPQIRLTLMYVYDVPAQLLEKVSDEELRTLIDSLDVQPMYYIYSLANKIKNGEVGSEVSSDSIQESTDMTTSENSAEKTVDSSEKKKGFPMTGDQSTSYLLIAGVVLIGSVLLFKRFYRQQF